MSTLNERYPETVKFIGKYIDMVEEPTCDFGGFFRKAVEELDLTGMDGLKEIFEECGIRYPQQTFMLCYYLRWALDIARAEEDGFSPVGDYPCIPIQGMSGFGKTAITKEWAKENDIALIRYNASISTQMEYREDADGVFHSVPCADPDKAARELVFSSLIKAKDVERAVLLLDDYHLATPENDRALREVIATHCIEDPATGECIKLKNLLFTIIIKTV